MPREVFGMGYDFLPRGEILSFEEMTRLARIFVASGVEKVRVTGGEPLLRRDVERLVAQLAGIAGLRDLTLTTNGSLLVQKAAALRAAGLGRLTVSLDSLDDATFRRMNDADFPVSRVLAGIKAARGVGFAQVKINMVVKRSVNEADIVALAQRFDGPGSIVRFIEYMDVGNTNGWRLDDVVPAAEIVARLRTALSLTELPANYPGETARRYRTGAGGEIGIVASVTQPFCSGCTRARLAADGRLYTCLFASEGTDLRAPLRSGASNADLAAIIAKTWAARSDRYSELRTAGTPPRVKAEMSRLGG